MNDHEETCPDCEDRHWLHMGEPFEIQWCHCAPGDDGEAVELHRKDCGCDWPDVDYQHLVWRFLDTPRNAPKELTVMIERFRATAAQRSLFVLNIDHLVTTLGEILELYYKHWDELGGRTSYLFGEIQGVACVLTTVSSRIRRGQWKTHWTLDPEDGVFENNKWTAPKDPIQGPLDDLFTKVVLRHAPKLQAAIETAKLKRSKPELDYKKLYIALKEAIGDMKHSGMLYNTSLVEEAMRHLLEVHPDADISEG